MPIRTILPGTKVRIKEYNESPEFWDSEDTMMGYCGKIMTIKGECHANTYSMVEDNGRWEWREIDFEIVQLPGKTNPNFLFKMNKKTKG